MSPQPVAVVEMPKESWWAHWGPTIVAGVVLAVLLFGLGEWQAAQRVEDANQREDRLIKVADKRALQQTLYVADLTDIVMPEM